MTLPALARSLLLPLPLGLVVGSACALFLASLDLATSLRIQHPWLLYLLPLAGFLVALLYQRLAPQAHPGTHLILDEIHNPRGSVPTRIAPLILLATLITHLFGGSAGREGTAIQMGGGIASAFARLLRPAHTPTVLMAGIAAGFGGVFGTPLAATIFATEVLTPKRLRPHALVPCLLAALVAHLTCTAWGVHHTHYPALPPAPLDALLAAKIILAALAFGLTACLFSRLAHATQRLFARLITRPLLRPVLGGIGVIGLAALFGADYLGLGVSHPDPAVVTLTSAFHPAGAHTWSWLLKILFTILTLSSGFKGGEVTPLFFIGATLGNTLSHTLAAPTDLFAALGFVSLFAAAANTPIACTVMAAELFAPASPTTVVYFAIACLTARLAAGPQGIYHPQPIATKP